ncbi:glycosyltransferase [Paenibacillus polymyxa]|uniref:glycosyltransferase family protein n=1 Tax=Paenibacillus polymyxa TaxID=1406 RepID=UPI002AB580E2|nr:glycosyltransferase [Paenibacillus polymyxa]MDY8021266.1 glycosyltransferase [Paenibacillus polymyxa]
MNKRKTVLYPPTLNFSFLKQTPQQISEQFADHGYDVIFCNNTQSDKSVEEVYPHVYVYHNFQDVLNKIKHKQLKIDVYYYTWAKSSEYVDQIKAKINIYNRVDEFPDWASFEQEAMDKADIIFTTSQKLYEKTQESKPTYLIRNACPDSYIARNSEVPEEYKNIDEPIVMFSGAIGSWISTSLIRKVADKYKTFLVGQEFGKECPKNVINLGVKNHEELHAYYQHANVSLIPFNLKDGITHSSCPLKLFEAMAAGTLSVATKWGETDIYPEAVLTAKTDEEFLNQVDKAIQLSANNSKFVHRITKKTAKQNTWKNRFMQIEGAINEYCEKSGVMIG